MRCLRPSCVWYITIFSILAIYKYLSWTFSIYTICIHYEIFNQYITPFLPEMLSKSLMSLNSLTFIWFIGLVIPYPRIDAEGGHEFSSVKFQSDVSSGISFQDVRMSPLTGFHSMSEKDKEKKVQGPTFDTTAMRRTITAINGKSIELSCNVLDLGNKTVRISIFI